MRFFIPPVLAVAAAGLGLSASPAIPISAAAAAPPPCRFDSVSGRLGYLAGNRLALTRVGCAEAKSVVMGYGRLRCRADGGNTCPRTVVRADRIWKCSAPTYATAQQQNVAVRCAANYHGRHVIRVRDR